MQTNTNVEVKKKKHLETCCEKNNVCTSNKCRHRHRFYFLLLLFLCCRCFSVAIAYHNFISIYFIFCSFHIVFKQHKNISIRVHQVYLFLLSCHLLLYSRSFSFRDCVNHLNTEKKTIILLIIIGLKHLQAISFKRKYSCQLEIITILCVFCFVFLFIFFPFVAHLLYCQKQRKDRMKKKKTISLVVFFQFFFWWIVNMCVHK